jgi:hypothetical protein
MRRFNVSPSRLIQPDKSTYHRSHSDPRACSSSSLPRVDGWYRQTLQCCLQCPRRRQTEVPPTKPPPVLQPGPSLQARRPVDSPLPEYPEVRPLGSRISSSSSRKIYGAPQTDSGRLLARYRSVFPDVPPGGPRPWPVQADQPRDRLHRE